ncbi:alpha/beta hydrolase [Dyella subtropica]|uniref:alpha/beta hydrolase n=1 Tax=Dyella subtropica TaxID=2992127 RepID=UPI0022538F43|nr:alpha/beta hydrolase-fold protein [Dyella subtropica]
MLARRFAVVALLGYALLGGVALARTDAPRAHHFFRVTLGSEETAPVSGRLLLFVIDAKVAKAQTQDGKVEAVDVDPLNPGQTLVAAREVTRLAPGESIDLDADALAFPSGLAQLAPGDYLVQAVLDADHSYNYTGRSAGDVISEVVPMRLPEAIMPKLQLVKTLPAKESWTLPPSAPQAQRDALSAAQNHAEALDFVSPSLSAFWGRPIHMRGLVLVPPGYDPKGKQRYPVVYYTHGFGGGIDRFSGPVTNAYVGMEKGQMPPMIWVFLDQSSPTGTHEFADSVNNGPWGKALTEELIPHLESHYHMDGKVRGRFLNGHSSGGWATLWLQTRYPKVFGGTWSTSPDPSDFHDFTGIDLYAPKANAYREPDGSAYPLIRDKGKVLATFQQFAQLERVLGSYGGQIASFEWVFSPRGKDGHPQPMFDRDTGDIDPAVVAYWSEHYDIAKRLQAEWPKLKPDLDGKIHLFVGTADTFYLDGAAHRLKAVLDGLHAKADIRFIPDKTHFDLYAQGDDRFALLKQITWEMYAVARPKSDLKPVTPTP